VGLTYKGIMTFLPAYMGENVDVRFLRMDPVALGGSVATLALLSGAVGQYVAGSMLDRRRAENLYLVALLCATVFVFLMATTTDTLLVVSSMLYAVFYFASQPIQNYLLAKYVPRPRQGLGYGILFFMTFGVGSTAAAICGHLADRFGLRSVFYFAGICFVVAACLAFVLVTLASRREKTLFRTRQASS
jgi:MFS family permease